MIKTPPNPYSTERNYYKTKEQENSVRKLLAKGYVIDFAEFKGNNLYYLLHKSEDIYKKVTVVDSNGNINTNIFNK